MVVIKGDVIATTTVKSGRISKTELALNEADGTLDRLRDYLRPLVNDFVKRRILPTLAAEGTLQVQTRIKIRESKRSQTVTIEQS
jgi:hypothetical protein